MTELDAIWEQFLNEQAFSCFNVVRGATNVTAARAPRDIQALDVIAVKTESEEENQFSFSYGMPCTQQPICHRSLRENPYLLSSLPYA